VTGPTKVALAGAGAFGIKHLDGIKNIEGVEVVSLVGRRIEPTREVAAKYGIAHVATDLADSLAMKEVDAVILCTPTQMHAAQSIACLNAGKHVQVEIPLADSWRDAQAVVDLQKQTGLVAMCGHTRRFNPSHQWVHRKVVAGERAGPTPKLDRPFAVASRRPHCGSFRVPDALAHREGECGARPYSSDARNRDGHVNSAQGRQWRNLHPQSVF
jgi:predicted dehydrogenase